MTDDDEPVKIKLNNNSLADEIKFKRPDLVLDVDDLPPDADPDAAPDIFTGDRAVREAAEYLAARRNPK